MPPPFESRNDPFSILGLAPGFDLDTAAVERAFLLRVAAAHPDRVVDDDLAGPADPDTHTNADAEARVAQLSLARETLLDAERRAVALLALLGGPDASADRSLPAGFLQEMLEVREAMEQEIAAEGDPARRRWGRWAQERRQGHVERLRGWFSAATPPLAEIRRELNAWRYVERLLEQLASTPGPAAG